VNGAVEAWWAHNLSLFDVAPRSGRYGAHGKVLFYLDVLGYLLPIVRRFSYWLNRCSILTSGRSTSF